MSDVSQGPGWWQASDGRWYPPESHPHYQMPAQVQPVSPRSAPAFPTSAPAFPTNEPAFPASAPAPLHLPPLDPTPDHWAAGPFADPGVAGWSSASVKACQHRVVGPGLVVLGLAVVLWGVGAVFNAVAALDAGFPHNEQIGAWISAIALLTIGVVMAVIGLLLRRG
jgi:hypothetical protein